MKTIATFLFTCALSWGAYLETPVLSPDSQPLDPNSPGLGVQIYANPGSGWQAWFNDNWGNNAPYQYFGSPECPAAAYGCDFDFNDAVAFVSFSGSWDGIVAAHVLYAYSESANDNDIRLLANGNYLEVGQSAVYDVPAGSLFTLQLLDETTSHAYVTGPASLNPDGVVHAWVSGCDPTTATPEPATMVLMGGALIFGSLLLKRRKGVA